MSPRNIGRTVIVAAVIGALLIAISVAYLLVFGCCG